MQVEVMIMLGLANKDDQVQRLLALLFCGGSQADQWATLQARNPHDAYLNVA